MEIRMSSLSVPHDALVFVGDGTKALFLRNAGDETIPNLVFEHVFNGHTSRGEHPHGLPIHSFEQTHTHRRSSMPGTDWHDLERHRFVDVVASTMETLIRARKAKSLVIVAPARTLAELRHAFHADVKKHIIAEVEKDLT